MGDWVNRRQRRKRSCPHRSPVGWNCSAHLGCAPSASWAMASRWSTALVLPPTAYTAAMAFSSAGRVMSYRQSRTGRNPQTMDGGGYLWASEVGGHRRLLLFYLWVIDWANFKAEKRNLKHTEFYTYLMCFLNSVLLRFVASIPSVNIYCFQRISDISCLLDFLHRIVAAGQIQEQEDHLGAF